MPTPRAQMLLSACLLATVPALAQASPGPDAALDRPLQLPGLLLDDATAMASAPWRWTAPDWGRLALGSAAVLGTAMLLDRPLRKAAQRNDGEAVTRWSHNLEPIGTTYSLLAAGGFYAFGLVAKDAEARATGADALAAMTLTAVALVPLKEAAGRARPYQELGPRSFKPLGSRDAFPSRHAAVAFTAAAVITEHYPQTWVQVTAYGLASLTGLSRIQQNQHWTSDVVAGALIGAAIGKGVTRLNQRLRSSQTSRTRFLLEPELGLGYQGVRVGLAF